MTKTIEVKYNLDNKMKRRIGFFTVTTFGLAFALLICNNSAFAQDTIRLSLSDALKIAESENLTVKIADKEITKTEYAKKGTYASLFPQIDFSANYQRAIKKQVVVFSGQTIEMGLNNTYSTGFSLAMPLVNVPLWKSLNITGMDVDLAVEKAKSSRQDLIDQVQQTFYSVLLAKDSYNVYKENYENTLRNYNEVKQKYDNGTTAKYDLIRAEVNVQNAIPNMYNALNSIEVTKWKLKALIGVDLNTPVECSGSLQSFSNNLVEVALNEQVSIEDNTNIKQLQIQSNMLDETYKMKLAKYYPTLNLALDYNWVAMEDTYKFGTYNWNPYSTGTLALKIPIFSGGQRYHDLKQTKVQQEQMQLQMEDTRRNLEVAVRQTLNTMETAVMQYDAAQKGIEGAETGYEISRKRYEIGSGTLLEMNDAQLALLQARLNLNQSVYNYLIAKSTLDKTLGVNCQNTKK